VTWAVWFDIALCVWWVYVLACACAGLGRVVICRSPRGLLPLACRMVGGLGSCAYSSIGLRKMSERVKERRILSLGIRERLLSRISDLLAVTLVASPQPWPLEFVGIKDLVSFQNLTIWQDIGV
jgi:hypothetical protein